MVRELATLDDKDLKSMSSEDLKSSILGIKNSEKETETIESEKEVEEEDIGEDANNVPEVEEENNQEEVIKDTQPTINQELEYLRKQNELLLMELTNQKTTIKKEEPTKKEISKEELLDMFADDPAKFIEDRIKPYKDGLKQLETKQIRENARRYNKDFARLETVVDKLITQFPNIAQGESPSKKLETYYLIAKGLEAQNNEMKMEKESLKTKEQRLENKKKASSIPVAKNAGKVSTPSKPINKMSASELKKLVLEVSS